MMYLTGLPLVRVLLTGKQFIRLANTLQRGDENARERLLPVTAMRRSFFCFCSGPDSLVCPQKNPQENGYILKRASRHCCRRS